MPRIRHIGAVGPVVCKRAFRYGGRSYEIGALFTDDTANIRKVNQLISAGYLKDSAGGNVTSTPVQAQDDGSITESEHAAEVVTDNVEAPSESSDSSEATVEEGISGEVEVAEVQPEVGSVESEQEPEAEVAQVDPVEEAAVEVVVEPEAVEVVEDAPKSKKKHK